MQVCSRRCYIVKKGDKVYCPDGTAYLLHGEYNKFLSTFGHLINNF